MTKSCLDSLDHRKFDNSTSVIAQYFYSFHFQDWIIYALIDSGIYPIFKDPVYVELAVNEPIRHSNTFIFDKCHGWKGICVEPNPAYHKSIFLTRRCKIEDTCVSNETGVVTFTHQEGASKIVSEGTTRTPHKKKIQMFSANCTTLDSILERHGYTHVNYMSLDIEGHELQALMSINWSKRTFDILTIENPSEHIIQYLKEKSVHYAFCVGPDGFFVHENYIEQVRRWFRQVGQNSLHGCIHADLICEPRPSCMSLVRDILALRGGKSGKLLDTSVFRSS